LTREGSEKVKVIKQKSLKESRESAALPEELEQEITELELENMEQEQGMTDMELDILELQEKIGG
jgi:hypothetical protein